MMNCDSGMNTLSVNNSPKLEVFPPKEHLSDRFSDRSAAKRVVQEELNEVPESCW